PWSWPSICARRSRASVLSSALERCAWLTHSGAKYSGKANAQTKCFSADERRLDGNGTDTSFGLLVVVRESATARTQKEDPRGFRSISVHPRHAVHGERMPT